MFKTTVPLKIYDNVKNYFKRNNMNYDVQEIIPNRSLFNHNLYIVIAKHTNYPEIKKIVWRWSMGCLEQLE